MTEGISLALNCPSCAGGIAADEGASVASCPSCGSLLYLRGDQGVHTVRFKNTLDEDRVSELLTESFNVGPKALDLAWEAEVSESFPIYVPFWRLRARACGWVCGTTGDKGKEAVEKMVLGDHEWSGIACDAHELGITRLPSASGEVVGHEEGSIPTFAVTSSADDARRRGAEWILEDQVGNAGVARVSFKKVQLLHRYLGLVYYPLWICRYTYKGRSYFATFDGVHGSLLSGRAPGDPRFQGVLGAGGAAVGGALSGWSVVALLMLRGADIGLYGALFGIVIFFAATAFFRHGSEITDGELKSKHRVSFQQPFGKALKSAANKAFR
jgi:hypothetical protein